MFLCVISSPRGTPGHAILCHPGLSYHIPTHSPFPFKCYATAGPTSSNLPASLEVRFAGCIHSFLLRRPSCTGKPPVLGFWSFVPNIYQGGISQWRWRGVAVILHSGSRSRSDLVGYKSKAWGN